MALEAAGRSGGIALAWRDDAHEKLEEWRGRHVVAARLSRCMDGLSWVAPSAYGPQPSARQMELWEDLSNLAITFQGTPVIIGGDFNVTLEAADRRIDLADRTLARQNSEPCLLK